MDLPDSDRGDFSCRRAVDSPSLFYPYYFSLLSSGWVVIVTSGSVSVHKVS